ncbi:MAG: extracellular solute-binding protein [Planctomycetota bacterium]|nr:MAG: extracellular solute-binding protein [Planctomycetota bacterium]
MTLRPLLGALRWTLAAAAAVLVVWSFARVIGRELKSPTAADGTVELTVMHWSGEGGQEEDRIVEGLLRAFEAEHPGVRVRRINPGDTGSYYTKLQTMMAAGEPPDVFYVGTERLASFAAAGLLAPVEPFLAEDAAAADPAALDLADFYPATVDAFRFDGRVTGRGPLYGIPKDFTTVGFYWNADLFRRAGVPPPAPDWTWDDFLAAARAIGDLEDPDGSRPYRGAEFVTWPTMVRLFLRTWGVDLVDPDFRRLRFDEPEVFAALDRLRSWRHDEPRTLTSGKSRVAAGASVFRTGRVGMAGPFGRWVVPGYRQIEGFEWDFAPLPRAPGRPPENVVLTVAWAVSSRSRHPRRAWELVRHLCGPEAQAAAAPLGLAVPTLRAVAESPAFLDPDRAPANDRAYLDQAEYARTIDWPADPKFEALLGSRLDQALKTGDLPLPAAIDAFTAAWENEIASPLARGGFPPMPWDRIVAVTAGLGGALLLFGLAWWWRRRPGRLALREELAGWLVISPWLIGFLVFLAFPIGLSLLLSLARWNGVAGLDRAEWVGLANYAQLLGHDDRFRVCLRVTAYYALLAVPLGQAFALGAALLMNQRVRGIGFFRGAWYLPSVLAGVGVAVLWRWVFDGDHGLLNAALRPLLAPFGLTPPDWFGADAAWWGPPAFALMSLWTVGGSMMIYLAGLKGIPRELYEAAEIDGAGWWRRFRSVTLPMLSPVIFFNGIMAVIGSFQVFTQAFVMTGGEPGDLTRFYVLYLYNQAFEFYEMGYASALAWLLLLVTLALTLVVMRGSRRFVHYEALQS